VLPRAASAARGLPGHGLFQGLTEPTVVDFAPDGRVFVGEKSGIIKVFDSLSDTQPTGSPTSAQTSSTTATEA